MSDEGITLENARTMTAGYSDSEDRIWLRFGAEEQALQVWMTRRLLVRAIGQIWTWLADSCELPAVTAQDPASRRSAALAEREVALEVKQPMNTQQARDAEPKAMSHRPEQAGVIQHISLRRVGRGSSRLTFSCSGGKVTMAFDRPALHRMLQMLGRTSQRASWEIGLPWES